MKFNGLMSVADSTFGDGSAKITAEGFPIDYAKTYSVDELDADISDDSVSYKNAIFIWFQSKQEIHGNRVVVDFFIMRSGTR